MLPFVGVPDVQLSPLAVRADPIAVLAEIHGGHLITPRMDRPIVELDWNEVYIHIMYDDTICGHTRGLGCQRGHAEAIASK